MHIGYWALYVLLLAVMFLMMASQARGRVPIAEMLYRTPIGVVAILPNIISFYGFYLVVFPYFLRKRHIAGTVITAFVFSILSAVIGIFTAYIYLGTNQPLFEHPIELLGFAGALGAVAAIHGTIALVIRGFIEWYGDIKLKEEIARKNHEMELSLVRAQMDPHFLFNTLSNIDVLIGHDPAKASEYLGKLSDMMRFATYDTHAEFIPLVDELAYIEKYIALQKIRMSEPEKVSLKVNGNPEGREVAPMIFIPFIENAFKHSGRGKIEIRFDITDSEINLHCANSYNSKEDSPSGIGSELIRRRLELIYPGQHELQVSAKDKNYTISLKLAPML